MATCGVRVPERVGSDGSLLAFCVWREVFPCPAVGLCGYVDRRARRGSTNSVTAHAKWRPGECRRHGGEVHRHAAVCAGCARCPGLFHRVTSDSVLRCRA